MELREHATATKHDACRSAALDLARRFRIMATRSCYTPFPSFRWPYHREGHDPDPAWIDFFRLAGCHPLASGCNAPGPASSWRI